MLSREACFEKNKKLTPTLLYRAHSQQNQLFQFIDVQNPKMSFGNLQKMCFWAWGRFGMSNNLPICLPICKCSTNSFWSSTKVDRTYLPVNMTVALFHKHLETNRNISEMGIGEIGFCFNWIAYWYCLLAPVILLGITRAYWPLLWVSSDLVLSENQRDLPWWPCCHGSHGFLPWHLQNGNRQSNRP